MKQPSVSVITINFNMRDGLEKTIESVLAQTYSNLEFIVIDGDSTDGSIDVIRRFAQRVNYWTSERDQGRYDAMNKGVSAASGDWVIFINAGDLFHDPDVISDVFRNEHEDADLVYGHHIKRYPRERVERLVGAESPVVLPVRMNCSHQSLFARRAILLVNPFSLAYSIAADHEFLIKARIAGARFKMVDRVISIFFTGGASDRNRFESWREQRRIVKEHGWMTFGLTLTYLGIFLRALPGPVVKRVLPRRVISWLLRHKTFG